MSGKFVIRIFLFLLLLLPARSVAAIYDPLSVPNNKLGIHILDPSEIWQAAKVVNADGGQWGYVTIPLRSDDRDRLKWQNFFAAAANLKIIPIIRLATFSVGDNWIKPTDDDVLDFANFLDTLRWPTKNRYVVIFNEPNHAQEWGGQVSPQDYTQILSFAVDVFHRKSDQFFVLPAGLDSAAPNSDSTQTSRNFLSQMASSDPSVFKRLDGWTSHSYPNPDFAGYPSDNGWMGITGYRYETRYLRYLSGRTNLPVFITETGWQHQDIPPETVAGFLKIAFNNYWNDPNIVTVTPFVLSASDGPFLKFSFLDRGAPTPQSLAWSSLSQTVGQPLLSEPLPAPTFSVAPQSPPTQATIYQMFFDQLKSYFNL